MVEETCPFSDSAIEEAARVLADLLHADEPGTAYDLARAVLNSAGVQAEASLYRRHLAASERELLAVLAVVNQAEAGEFATAGRDFGRGVAEMARRVRAAMGDGEALSLLGGGVVESSSAGAPIDIGFLSLPQETQDAGNMTPHPNACPDCGGIGTFAHPPGVVAATFHYAECPRLEASLRQATADAALDEAERTGGAYTAREPRGDRA